MNEEIYKGFNCTRRDSRPTLRLRLKQRRFSAKPNQEIRLELMDRHPFCDPACYSWMIRAGGGTLSQNFGEHTIYTAASGNKGCVNNAVVDVSCVMTYLDRAFITITQVFGTLYKYARIARIWPPEPRDFTKLPDLAYGVISGEIYAPPYTGVKTFSPTIGWYWPRHYMEAAYFTRCYDCKGTFLYKVIGLGTKQWGTAPPIKKLKKDWSYMIGHIYDYRTKELKDMMCCPPRLFEAIYEEEP